MQKLAWDGFNRLAALETPSGKTEYAYDVFGRRIAKRHNGQTTTFVWDGDVIALERSAEQTRHYLFEAGSFVPLAQVVEKGGEGSSKTSHTAYYHVDHLGTPQLLTDADGEVAWQAEYKAWGEAKAVISQAAHSAGIDNPIRFQGQYFDAESGLHYNRHRYYDPETGRFISSDPIGLLGGGNVYAYGINPIEWIDPNGLAAGKNRPQNGWNYTNMPDIDGFQKHHIIPQGVFKKNHPALTKAGVNVHDQSNIIYLPKCRDNHAKRTVHNGSHPSYNAAIERRLDAIEQAGQARNWSETQYKEAVSTLLNDERKKLKQGSTILNKNSTPPNCGK